MRVACCLLLFVLCPYLQAAEPRLTRVDDHVYRGRQPTKEEYGELARQGIKTVLDLRGGMIHKPHERKLVEAAGMQYVSIRLSGIFAPRDEQIARILAVLEDPAREPVFVHCRRGDDRLGLVIACYRIAHDHWSNQQALDEACHLGLSRFELLMRHYIRHFDPVRALASTPRDAERARHTTKKAPSLQRISS